MKIMYISDTLAIWGGIERVLSCKAWELTSRYGYELRFVTVNQGGHPLPYELPPGASHVDLGIGFHRQYQYGVAKRLLFRRQMNRLCRQRLRDEIERSRPDVIVLITLALASVVCPVFKGIPFIYESHSSFYSDKFDGKGALTLLNTYLNRRFLRKASAIVALTELDAQNWRQVNPQVAVIPNIVRLNDSGLFSDTISRRAIFVGRFTTQKAIGDLLSVWQLVHQRHPDWHLDIYGEGELKDHFTPIAESMQANIHIHAPEADIFQRYREHAMLLLTSVYEPFGLVLPEAMSCGLPVISFDCPYGPADIITDGVDGFLIQNRSIETFADRVCQLIEDESRRRQMGIAAIQSAQRYSAENIMPQWKSLFESLCPKSD